MTYVYRIGREAIRKSIALHGKRLTGRCLDVGAAASESRYRGLLPNVTEYVSLDIDPSTSPQIVANAEAMRQIRDGSFDSLLSTQVMYAVPHPDKAIGEFARVLKPGGLLLLSVPFLNLWIGEHDYWRFSPAGIRLLLEEHGFEVVALEKTGVGVWSVVHQLFAKRLKAGLELGRRRFVGGVFSRLFSLTAKLALFLDRLSRSGANEQFFLDVTVLAKKQ